MNTTGSITYGSVPYLQNLMKRSFIRNLRASTRFWALGEANSESMTGYATFSRPRLMRLNKTVSDIELTEGVTPNSVDFKVVSVETSPTQYGMLGVITDRLEAMSLIDLIPRMGEEIADNMARCIDKAIQAELLADGVNVRYAGSATSVATLTSVDNLTP
jgi:hypothetical protein